MPGPARRSELRPRPPRSPPQRVKGKDDSNQDSPEKKSGENKEDQPDDRNSTACNARALGFLEFLGKRPEKHIAVVSHWAWFLGYLAAPPQHGAC